MKLLSYLGTYTRQVAIAQSEIRTGLQEIVRCDIRHGPGSEKLFPFQILFRPVKFPTITFQSSQ